MDEPDPQCPYPLVILCGGLGLRMRDFTKGKPKALVRIGTRPVLWHVMKLYSHFGVRRFILPLGHGGEQIIEWFEHYLGQSADFTLRLSNGTHTYHTRLPGDESEWRVTFVHAGTNTETGGRLLRAAPYIDGDRFLATYTDGLTDADISAELDQHLRSSADVTLLSVQVATSFGILESEGRTLTGFNEKPRINCEVNGGFFVMNSSVLDEIEGDESILEQDVLPRLARQKRIQAFPHDGYWQCMDTPKHVQELKRIWDSGRAPWKLWND